MQYNGCGTGSTAGWIPQLDFGQCCDMHDYCYDNCQGGQVELCNSEYCSPGYWEGCNGAFLECMLDTACSNYPWYNPIGRGACELAAAFYFTVVSTPIGVYAFEEATEERCAPYCPSGSPMCNGRDCSINIFANDDYNCGGCGWTCLTANHGCISGKCTCTADVQNDNNNCGGCGHQCPYKTHCSAGGCVCDDEQCGNMCVDIEHHPRNCGACGHVCSSGYCFEGQCYDPPTTVADAPVCLPTGAIQNGGFGRPTSSH